MGHYLIGLGSNIEPHTNLPAARRALAQRFCLLSSSPTVETPAQGDSFHGVFLNQLLVLSAPLAPEQLKQQLLAIEEAMGREPKSLARRYRDRTIDIDILAAADSPVGCIDHDMEDPYYQLVLNQWQRQSDFPGAIVTS